MSIRVDDELPILDVLMGKLDVFIDSYFDSQLRQCVEFQVVSTVISSTAPCLLFDDECL